MSFHDTVHNGNVCAWDFVNCYVSSVISFARRVREEQEVAAVERRFHRATTTGEIQRDIEMLDDAPEHHNDRRLRVTYKSKAFPDHESRCEH